ncbi:hypothetical protein EWM64_g2754 [Hericium alpestre]|uniref:Uncharacterized protein n=1 Tax=Hericium alpestre TaxID=135208 RepID=A0A4Z0A475_9AGAM|nr:hypothetical protein EWM64_g2754 [Hericium alpestre]
MRCAGYDDEPKPKAAPKAKTPRAAPRTKLTDEEKAQKREEAAERKAFAEKKKEWKAALKPWNVDTSFRLRIGTMAMYKSDGLFISPFDFDDPWLRDFIPLAKHAYGLTEEEILTLPHESIPNSSKTFFSCQTAADLSLKKDKFFDPEFEIPPADEKKQISRGLVKKPRAVFKKTDNDVRRRKANFIEMSVIAQIFIETKDPNFIALLEYM